MTILTMKSWRKDIQVVSLVKAVKDFSTGSLIQSKAAVERLLTGKPVTLTFSSEMAKDEFKRTAETLGVIFE